MDIHRYGFYRLAAPVPLSKVGNCTYNAEQIVNELYTCAEKGADIAAFPALALTAASCGDLFGQRVLLASAEHTLTRIAAQTAGLSLTAVVGFPFFLKGRIYNAAAVFGRGQIYGIVPLADTSPSRFFSRYDDSSAASVVLDGFQGTAVPFSPHLIFEHAVHGLSFRIGTAGFETAPAGLCIELLAEPSAPFSFEDLKRNYAVWSKKNSAAVLFVNAGWTESSTDAVYAGEAGIFSTGEELAASNGFSFYTDGTTVHYTAADSNRTVIADIDTERLYTAAGSSADGIGVPCRSADSGTCLHITVPEPPPLTEPPLFPRNPMPFIPLAVQNNPADLESFFARMVELPARGLVKRMKYTGSTGLVLGISGGLDSTLALLVSHAAAELLGLPGSAVTAVTMPGFGTTKRTKSNALLLAKLLGCTVLTIPIKKALTQHFSDIGHDPAVFDTVYENAQARERTQILMDKANQLKSLLVGTGDLSEAALGWSTYNGDHISMYNVNTGIPKTLLKHCIAYFKQYPPVSVKAGSRKKCSRILQDILETPISPELLPAENHEISQKTEDILGPYELHDFFLYYILHTHFSPRKVLFLAEQTFAAPPYNKYTKEEILRCLKRFYSRFFSQQFKRSCSADGPAAGCGSFSPRGAWCMPSDACADIWLAELDALQ